MAEEQAESNACGSERDFLHDLSNPLAIAYGNLKILTMKLDADLASLPVDDILQRLHKAVGSFEKANQLLDARRTHLRSQPEDS